MSESVAKCRFYYATPSEVSAPAADGAQGFRVELWRPSILRITPPGMFQPSLAVWWGFHTARLFRNRRYGVLMIYDGDRPIHRSVMTPGWLRFPFMGADDLQIGATWTDPGYRGRGLAVFAIEKLVDSEKGRCPRFWYLTEETNGASIRAAEKAGFTRYLEGTRTKRFGLRVLGSFVPDREMG